MYGIGAKDVQGLLEVLPSVLICIRVLLGCRC